MGDSSDGAELREISRDLHGNCVNKSPRVRTTFSVLSLFPPEPLGSHRAPHTENSAEVRQSGEVGANHSGARRGQHH
jgi:hypothetical protein